MIVGGFHWLPAVAVALAIHLAGILWLSLPQPVRQPLTERAGESIAVRLGPDARQATTEVAALSPEESPDVEAAAESAATRPEPAPAPASPPAAGEATATPAVIASAPVDTARPVTPSSLQEVVESGPETAVQPGPSNPANPVDAGSQAPETMAAREVSATKPADVVLSDIETAGGTTADIEPTHIETAHVDTSTAGSPEAEVALPAEFAEKTTDPAPAEATVAQVPAPVTEIATSGAEAGDASTPSPEAAMSVEETPVEASRDGIVRLFESAEIAPAEQPGIEVTAARPPNLVVEGATEPGVRDAVQPEVIDLEALQESGGGSAVAAHYAGVLKGWLQDNMHYPRAARLAGQEGEVVVRFVIDRQGNVQSIVVEAKSGFPLLDREAREMIERGDPFPSIPDGMPGQKLEVRVPIDFHVRDETMTKEIPPIYLE